MVSDVAALALSLLAVCMASRPASGRRTFGNSRAEILAALADPVGSPDDLDPDADSPIRDLLVPEPAPEDPIALAGLLESLRPAFVICHDLLSHEESPDFWLDALEGSTQRRAALLFVETTGVSPSEAPDEVRAVGDRIWSLLPERYASHPGEGQPYPSWSAAFERTACGARTGSSKPCGRASARSCPRASAS